MPLSMAVYVLLVYFPYTQNCAVLMMAARFRLECFDGDCLCGSLRFVCLFVFQKAPLPQPQSNSGTAAKKENEENTNNEGKGIAARILGPFKPVSLSVSLSLPALGLG